MIQVKLSIRVLALALAAFSFSACSTDMHMPGKLNENRVRVEQKTFLQEMDTDLVSDQFIKKIATHYERHGKGPVNLVMNYDPRSRENTALVAGEQVADLSERLRRQGVGLIEPSIIPVKDMGDKSRVIFSYDYYDTLLPENCSALVGYYKDAQIETEEDYRLGCTIETQFAKQIARPKDLAGAAQGNDVSDGRRAGNIVETYRSGAPNAPLEGQSATGN